MYSSQYSVMLDFLVASLSDRFRLSDLTGITPEVLEANSAEIFVDVWPRFLRWLTELDAADEGGGVPRAHGPSNPEGSVGMSLVFAAHNAKFDFRFILAELERGGIDRHERMRYEYPSSLVSRCRGSIAWIWFRMGLLGNNHEGGRCSRSLHET